MPTKIVEEVFHNFSGGVNWRDHPSELAENEMPYSSNVTIDERGGAMKRLGYVDNYGSAIGSGLVKNIFEWASQGKIVAQVGTGIHIDGGAAIHNFSTNDRVAFAEYNSMLAMHHPIDGVRFWNGSAISSPSTNNPLGSSIAAWQNRLWIAEKGGPRIWFTDIGTTNIANTNWVDLKEKDSSQINLLTGAAGQDISGRPGLLAFKSSSAYRIYDSNTGAYNTIDPQIGCSSNIGAVSAFGRTYVVSPKGVYWTDGLEAMKEQSQLVEPLFYPTRINQSRGDLFAAGRHADRLYFSFPIAGATTNSIVMEFHPVQNWAMPHTNAASCYCAAQNNTKMLFGSPTNNGRIYSHNTGGSDAGSPIASTLQTRWIEPRGGNKTRVRRVRFVGHGNFNATLLRDYVVSQSGATMPVNITDESALWDSGYEWNGSTSVWGPTSFQSHQDFWSLGTYRAFSCQVTETSTNVSTGRVFLEGVPEIEVGAWTLSHISMLTFGLGNY